MMNGFEQQASAIGEIFDLCYQEYKTTADGAAAGVDNPDEPTVGCNDKVIIPLWVALERKIEALEPSNIIHPKTGPWPWADEGVEARLNAQLNALMEAWASPELGYESDEMYAANRTLAATLMAACSRLYSTQTVLSRLVGRLAAYEGGTSAS